MHLARAIVLLLAAPALARPACTDGTYVLGDGDRAMIVAGSQVAFTPLCPPVEARLKRTSRGTAIRAVWNGCDGIAGEVRLRALVNRRCTRMAGLLRVEDDFRFFRAHRERCQHNVDCAAGSYCAARPGHCDDPGVCVGRPTACTRELAPVCGCDGQTYPNACTAAAAGVRVAARGACPAPASCATNAECAPEEYCAKDVGACDAKGACRPRATGCPDISDPVCGCDGQTYPNRCDAAAAGVSVASPGACPARCGTIAGIPCPEGQFCEFPPGTCDSADLEGRCVAVPKVCPDVFLPVCGCDKMTYGNDCERRAAQVQKAHDGECRCPVIICEPGTVPRDSDGDGCPDICAPACATNADCPAGNWCAAPPGHCRAEGACEERPAACPLFYEPVCGCDGQTYGNACEAASFGVRIASSGPCFPACRDAHDCCRHPFSEPCPLLCPNCGNFWTCEQEKCVEHCGAFPPGAETCVGSP